MDGLSISLLTYQQVVQPPPLPIVLVPPFCPVPAGTASPPTPPLVPIPPPLAPLAFAPRGELAFAPVHGKHERVKSNTRALSECITKND